jgi:hypothetical protein
VSSIDQINSPNKVKGAAGMPAYKMKQAQGETRVEGMT